MGSDACFRIGSTHKVCQDYAIAGARPDRAGQVMRPFAILSDGCSGEHDPDEPGSPFTDYGSRFLVRAATLAFDQPNGFEDLDGYDVARTAWKMARQAGLGSRSIDATLIRAVKLDDEIIVHQAGDGIVAARERATGRLVYYSASFGSNMPYYMSYCLDPTGELLRYFAMAKTADFITGVQENPPAWSERITHSCQIAAANMVREFHFDERFDLVLIMSDGAESFQQANGTPVPVEDVLDQFFQIKSFVGEFITRRCNRFLGKFCAEKGWTHADDLSVAGIYAGPAS
jgi:hypothetical protein